MAACLDKHIDYKCIPKAKLGLIVEYLNVAC